MKNLKIKQYNMAMVIAGSIGAAASLVGGIFGSISANSRAKAAAKKKKFLEDKLQGLQDDRQDIINPYENVTNLSGMLSNPMAQLGVATQAAEIQIEEADISLANTLDTIRSTGASAGGATALAQAALQSKKGVAASIEQQEAQNEKARAQGEANLQQQKMSEAQRIQQADVAGQSFVFDQTERREVSELNRVQNQIDGEAAAEVQARSDQMGAITGAIGGIGSMASSYMSGQAAIGSATGSTMGPTNTGSNSSYTIGGSIYDKLPKTTNFGG